LIRALRTATLAGLLVLGPLVLAASCVDRGAPPAPVPRDSGARDGLAASDGGTCPLPTDDPSRCSGNDPDYVFFPPLDCDPASLADASADTAPPFDASGDASAPMGPCYDVNSFDVSFTTPACMSFLALESRGIVATDGAAGAPAIMEPCDGDVLSPDNWSIFVWSVATARLSPLRRLFDWIEPSAYALSPLNGEGYVLEFSQGCTEILRVMVATTFWQPDPASWARLTARTGLMTVRVLAGKFANDALVPGTELRASAPITITMAN
jgi:hypothetical protein